MNACTTKRVLLRLISGNKRIKKEGEMEAEFMLDRLPDKDYQAALGIINQLAECRTRENLSHILKTSLLPLMGCSGAFYTRLDGKDNTPKLMDSINSSTPCRCWWDDLYKVATQSHLLDNSVVVEKASVLATEAFCCIGKSCSKCSIYSNKAFNHGQRNCAIVILFDSPNPTIAIYFHRFTTQTQLYSERDIELLQLLRATLIQTVNAVIYREESHNLQQILNCLPEHGDALAVVSDDGNLVYKNKGFDQAVGQEKCIQLLARLSQKTASVPGDLEFNCYLSKLGHRLYKVSLTTLNTDIHGNTRLNLLRLSRVIDKKLKINRKLDKAGLSSRELEIATLILQGISTHHVSEQLNLSYHTIRNHIKHIYSKIGVSTRSEMLTWGD
jgi:DNA-binding CsgD family transcriptional regulator